MRLWRWIPYKSHTHKAELAFEPPALELRGDSVSHHRGSLFQKMLVTSGPHYCPFALFSCCESLTASS